MRVVGSRTNLRKRLVEPRRIVSVGPSNTEILHALGLGRRIVGVDRWSDYPPRVRHLPRVGSDLHVDIASVEALRPDVVVASLHVPGMEDNLPAFEAAGLPYLAVGGEGLDGVWQDMRTIGELLSKGPRAEQLIAELTERMRAIEARCAGAPRKRVHWEWSPHPVVAGRRSWITELLQMAGGTNLYEDLDVESVRVSREEAIARQPEVVVACWCGYEKLPSEAVIRRRPGWEHTRVAIFAEDLFGRPGPRLADGLERLARLLHPEL